MINIIGLPWILWRRQNKFVAWMFWYHEVYTHRSLGNRRSWVHLLPSWKSDRRTWPKTCRAAEVFQRLSLGSFFVDVSGFGRCLTTTLWQEVPPQLTENYILWKGISMDLVGFHAWLQVINLGLHQLFYAAILSPSPQEVAPLHLQDSACGHLVTALGHLALQKKMMK